jgi:hypothetical protein
MSIAAARPLSASSKTARCESAPWVPWTSDTPVGIQPFFTYSPTLGDSSATTTESGRVPRAHGCGHAGTSIRELISDSLGNG